MRAALSSLVLATLLLGGPAGSPAEELPPAPTAWLNDYAGVVSPDDTRRLDQKLRRLDQETSTQVVVAVFPRLPSPSLEDFTARTAESWRVGRAELDNGAIFFVFVEDRKMRIEVGYGLEGALPDALAGRILNDEVVPLFRRGDWSGGIEAGVDGIVAAVRGEYTAPAPARAERKGPPRSAIVIIIIFLVIFLLLVRFGSPSHPGRTYGRRGWRRDSSHWGGGGWGGGGGGWGGGGGFSGGGGSFGGGGASSSW